MKVGEEARKELISPINENLFFEDKKFCKQKDFV